MRPISNKKVTTQFTTGDDKEGLRHVTNTLHPVTQKFMMKLG